MKQTKPYLLLFLAIETVLIILAIVFGKSPGQFFKEGSLMTWVSFIHLLLVSVICWLIFKLRHVSNLSVLKSPAVIWLIIAVGFVFLGLDEVLMIHEHMDDWIHILFNLPANKITDRIDDVIVGLYGLASLFVLNKYKKELFQFRPLLSSLIAGFIFLFSMVALDLIFHHRDFISLFISSHGLNLEIAHDAGILEEACKALAEACFVSGFYSVYKLAKVEQKQL